MRVVPEISGTSPHRFVRTISTKKLSSANLALKLVRETFLQIPVRYRRDMKIPPWYSIQFAIPNLVLRTKFRCLTIRQRVLSTLARMYYIYRFNVIPAYCADTLNTSSKIRVAQSDGLSTLLKQCFHTKHWYGCAAKLHSRLKVLLLPFRGW